MDERTEVVLEAKKGTITLDGLPAYALPDWAFILRKSFIGVNSY
jgi:hypothetical protein